MQFNSVIVRHVFHKYFLLSRLSINAKIVWRTISNCLAGQWHRSVSLLLIVRHAILAP